MARANADDAIAEVLIGEIVSDQPALLPAPEAQRPTTSSPQIGQLDGPEGRKEGGE